MRQALSMDHRKSFGVRVRAGGGRQRGAGASVVRVLGGSVGCWCGKLWWLADRLFFVDLLAESASVHISPWQSQILVVQDWHLVAAALLLLLCCAAAAATAVLLPNYYRPSYLWPGTALGLSAMLSARRLRLDVA